MILLVGNLKTGKTFMEEKKMDQGSKKKHGRKRYSILLVALLLIGVATYGTYAYFTDSKKVDSGLNLKKGSVTLGEFKDANWTYKGNTKEDDQSFTNEKLTFTNPNIEPKNTATTFTNVLPGDTFTKTITIPYTGTAKADITVKMSSQLPEGIAHSFTVTQNNTVTTIDKNEMVLDTISPNETLSFNLTIHIPYGAENDARNTAQSEDLLSSIPDLIQVTATQHLETTK